MTNDADRQDIFDAETFGATIARNLLRGLAVKEFHTAERVLDQSLGFPLIRLGLESINQAQLVDDLHQWLGGADTKLEYQHAKLTLRALAKLKVEPDVSLLELSMRRAYAAGDPAFANSVAEELLQKSPTLPSPVLVRCYDILGRIQSDQHEFEPAAKSFLAGAEAANRAGLDYDEWDQRTNLVWCLYAQSRYLDALRQIEVAERLARRIDKPNVLTKTLIDRGNSELALGRFEKAQTAYLEVVAVAEAANDLARQSDALGNLGNIAYRKGDYSKAEAFHRRALAVSREMNNPDSAQYDLNNLALALWQLGRSSEALDAAQEALEIANQRGDHLNIERYRAFVAHINSSLGKHSTGESLEQRKKEPIRASDSSSETIQESENERTMAFEIERRVRLLLSEQDDAGAIKLVEDQLATSPKNCRLLCLHGMLLATVQGDVAGARREYELALSYQPTFLEAHSWLVDLDTNTNQLAELLPKYQQLLRDDPFNPGVRVGLALIYSRIGRHEDSIQCGLEAVRLAPSEDFAYMALAEGQRERAFSLLESNWDAAWQDFQDFASTSDKMIEISRDHKSQWYARAATVYERFAIRSHHANPPIFGMGSREIGLLASAAQYCLKLKELEPWRKVDPGLERISNEICTFANPEQITTTAGYMRMDGRTAEALGLLMLSLSVEPDQGEANFQLAHIMNNGTEEGRKAALDFIGQAIELDPLTPKYREAQLHFQGLRFPVTDTAADTGNESD